MMAATATLRSGGSIALAGRLDAISSMKVSVRLICIDRPSAGTADPPIIT